MDNKFDLKINLKGIKHNPNGLSTGIIYFEYSTEYFPRKDWNDFLDVILNWWMEELVLNLKLKKNKFDFQFMDGSYKLEMDFNSADICHINALSNDIKVFEKVIDMKLESFLVSFSRAIRELIEFYEESKYRNEETEKLIENFQKLNCLVNSR